MVKIESTHNLGIGFKGDLSQINKKFDQLKEEVQNLTKTIQKSERIIKNSTKNMTGHLSRLNNEMDETSSNARKVSKSFRNSEDALQGSTKALQNYGMNLNYTNKQLKGFNNVSNDMHNNLDKAGQAANEYNKQINEITSKSKGLANATEKATDRINESKRAMGKDANSKKKLNKTTKNLNKNTNNWLSSYSESTAIALKSTAVWGIATSAIYGTMNAFREGITILKEINTEMVKLNRVMNVTTETLDKMKATAADMGVEMGQSMKDVVSSMVEWGRQGRSVNETLQLTENALLASNVAFMEANEAVDYLTSATLQFNIEADKSQEIVDRWNEVAKNYATTAKDLAASIQESGAAAKESGVSIDELIGLTTSLTAATSKSGNRVGNVLKTVFSRMKGRGSEGAEALGKVESNLNQVGIALRSSEGEFRSMYDVLGDLSTVWDELNGVQRANLSYALGGRRRYSDVAAIMGNFKMAIDATETSMNSQNSALEENKKVMRSIAKQWQSFKTLVDETVTVVGDEGFNSVILGTIENLKSMTESVQYTIKGLSEMKGILIGGGTIGGIVAILVNLQTVIKGVSAALSLLYAHPVITGLSLLAAGILKVANTIGKEKERVDGLVNSRKVLEKLRKNELDITKEQYKQAQDEIKVLDDNIGKIDKLIKKSKEAKKSKAGVNTLSNYEAQITKIKGLQDDLIEAGFGSLEGLEKPKEIIEQLNKLRDQYNDKITESIIYKTDELSKNVDNLRQQKETNANLRHQLNSYKEAREEINRINKLKENQGELNEEQSEQLDKLKTQQKTSFNILKEEFKSLDNINVGDKLTGVAGQLESKFKKMNNSINKVLGDGDSGGINDMIGQLEDGISRTTSEIDTLNNKMQNMSYGSGTQIAKEIKRLKEQKERYEELKEALENYKKLLNEDISFSEFYASTESGRKVIRENLINPLKDFEKQYNSILNTTSKSKLALNIKDDLLGLSGLDYDKQLQGIYQSQLDSLINLSAKLKQSELNRKDILESINKKVKENPGDKKLKSLYNELEATKSVSEMRDIVNDKLENTVTNLENINNRVDMGSSLKELSSSLKDLDNVNLDKNVFNMNLDELNNYESNLDSFKSTVQTIQDNLNNINPDTFESEEQVNTYNSLLNETGYLLDSISFAQSNVSDAQDFKEAEKFIQGLNDKYKTNVDSIKERLKYLRKQKEIISGMGMDTSIIDRAIGVQEGKLSNTKLENQLSLLKQIVGTYDSKEIKEGLNNWNEKLDKVTKNYKNISNKVDEQKDSENGVSGELLDQLNALEVKKELMEKFIKLLENEKDETEEIVNLLTSDKLASAIESGFSNVDLENELGNLKSKTQRIFEGLGQSLGSFINDNIDGIQTNLEGLFKSRGDENPTEKAKNYASAISQIGAAMSDLQSEAGKTKAYLTSIGAGIGAMLGGSAGAKLGSQVGSAIGGIGQAIFGGVEGDSQDAVDSLKEQVNSAKDYLKDYGVEDLIDEVKVDDDTGALQGLFGGSDLEILNEEKIKEQIERVKGIISKLGSGISNSLSNAITNGLSVSDFRKDLDKTLGKAIIQTIVENMMKSEVIKNAMGNLTRVLNESLKDDNFIDSGEMEVIKSQAQSTKNTLSQVYSQIPEIADALNLNTEQDIDNSSRQSFQAGSSSNYTFNSTYQINSTAYQGSKESARKFAGWISKYIEEDFKRRNVV